MGGNYIGNGIKFKTRGGEYNGDAELSKKLSGDNVGDDIHISHGICTTLAVSIVRSFSDCHVMSACLCFVGLCAAA